MLMQRDRLLFRVMVTHRDQHAFHAARESRSERLAGDFGIDPREPWFDEWRFSKDPPTYPYNDIYGFFEIFWDGGTRVLANCYFRGDARRRAGRRLRAAAGGQDLRSQGFFLHWHRKELAWLPNTPSPQSIRRVLSMALDRVDDAAKDLGGVAHLDHARTMLPHVNWDALMGRPGDA